MKKNVFLIFLICLFQLQAVFAQAESDDFVKNTQNDLLIVAGAGAAGAILGLSTLSFVERPSNHLRNVWTGAALGIIAGVVFVAYTGAQKGSEGLVSETEYRKLWHDSVNAELSSVSSLAFSSDFFKIIF